MVESQYDLIKNEKDLCVLIRKDLREIHLGKKKIQNRYIIFVPEIKLPISAGS